MESENRPVGPTVNQTTSLWAELELSVRLIERGLRELQAIDMQNDFYHLPLMTLASGFERYMKVILCLHHIEQTGWFPSPKDPSFVGRKGHDLSALLDRIVEECFPPSYIERIAVGAEDIAFLREDKRMRRVVRLLSEFGQASRYYHLDVILGASATTEPPEVQWVRLEAELVDEQPGMLADVVAGGGGDRAYDYLRQAFTAILERLARALARLFTIGKLGALAKQNMTFVASFLLIRDDELGTKTY